VRPPAGQKVSDAATFLLFPTQFTRWTMTQSKAHATDGYYVVEDLLSYLVLAAHGTID
jgi:hypothetical protein